MMRSSLHRSSVAVAANAARRRPLRRHLTPTAVVVLLVILAVPFGYPLLWMVASAFKTSADVLSPSLIPSPVTLSGVSRIFTANPFLRQYGNSLVMAAVGTVITVFLTAFAGYAFARLRFRGANAIFFAMMSTIFLPSEVTIIPIFHWSQELGLVDTWWPLMLPAIIGPGSVIATFIFRQSFLGLPTELEDAGRLDGLGRLGLFFHVAFPLAAPAIAAVSIITFLRIFSLYFEPLIFLRTPERFTVSLGLTRYQDSYGEPMFNTQLGATALTVIPILVVFFLAQRHFVEGLTRTGLK